MLIDKQHLTEGINIIGLPPWHLDSFDMLGFSYQRAESILGTKGSNVFMVMDESMLSMWRDRGVRNSVELLMK